MKENIGSENNKVIEKILQHIQEDKIESKKDLKLYGVDKPELQKELMWDIFEKFNRLRFCSMMSRIESTVPLPLLRNPLERMYSRAMSSLMRPLFPRSWYFSLGK